MKIGEAAQCTGLSMSNIRFYEKKKLLTPKREDGNQYRDYTEEDIERLKKIMILRKLDIPIDTIQAVFSQQMPMETALKDQSEALAERMQSLEGSMYLCGTMMDDAQIETMDTDKYLDMIQQEEKAGRHFVEVPDFVEDMADYVQMDAGRSTVFLYPLLGKYMYLKKYVALLMQLCLFGGVIYIMIHAEVHWFFRILWSLGMICWIGGFIRYRSNKTL